MPIPALTVTANPTTTYGPYTGPDRNSDYASVRATKSVAASGTFVLPWTFAGGSIVDVAFVNASNPVYGRLIVYTTGVLAVSAGNNLVTSGAGANQVTATISAGVITLTAHGTFTTADCNVAVAV